MQKIALFGAGGQLGSDIARIYEQDSSARLYKFDVQDFKLQDYEKVRQVLSDLKPDFVINTAAFHNVEKCEDQPEEAFLVNAIAVRNLAQLCQQIQATLIHISTDYVFSGKKNSPYLEDDLPGPLSVYGVSKLAGEHFVAAECQKYYLLRVCGLYGVNPCLAKGGQNFVDLMIRLARERGKVRVVNDEILTPTSTLEVARQIKIITQKNPDYGLYHCTAEGYCSWYQFAREIFQQAKIDVVLEEALPQEFAGRVKRPKYSVLENRRLKQAGLNIMRPWQEALNEYLKIKYQL